MRKRTVAAAAMAAAGGGLFFYAPLAAWADVVPAPDGTASSTAVSVGGQPVLSTGGQSNTANGSSSSGSRLSTGQVGPASAAVAPYDASSSAGGGSSKSASDAAVATGSVGGANGIDAAVVDSHSKATYQGSQTGGSSAGETSTCGACVQAGGPGGLDLQVLYADAFSNGTGNVWLVSVNGNRIGTSTDGTAAVCTALNLQNLLNLDCLHVGGGVGYANSHVASGSLGGATGLPF